MRLFARALLVFLLSALFLLLASYFDLPLFREAGGGRALAAQDVAPSQICGRVLALTCANRSTTGQLFIEQADGAIVDVRIPPELVAAVVTQLGQAHNRAAVCIRASEVSPEMSRATIREAGHITVVEGAPPGSRDVFSTCDPAVQPPVLLHESKPSYTAQAMRARAAGTVLLTGIVNELGGIEGIRTLRALEPSLDAASTEALAQWRFRPATRNGVAVAVPVTTGMTFVLSPGP